jgi:Ca2+-binding EF-hand superfamily protein
MKKRRAEGGAGAGRPDIAELIKKFDKDGDGKLNDQEKEAARASIKRPGAAGAPGEGRPNMAELIKKFDKNGDGKLDDEEKAAAKKAFAERRKGDK